MNAIWILTVLSIVFIALAFRRLGQAGGAASGQARTWFLVGGIFGAVAIWLYSRG